MKKRVKICSLKKLKEKIFLLELESPYLAENSHPGQFLHIKIEGKGLLLRRPFSIHKVEKDKVYILFKVRGKGTQVLSKYRRGMTLDVIGPLGRGFNYRLPATNYQLPVIVAGGVGIAPLLFLAQKLSQFKRKVLVFLGAKTKKEILFKEEFERLGCKVFLATEDGSSGFKGKITQLLKETLLTFNPELSSKIYACGPKEMLFEISKIVKDYPDIDCEASFEEFMGCGIGLCRACAVKTKEGFKRVCKEGPVFNIREVLK